MELGKRIWSRPSFYAVADPIVGNRLLRPEFSTSVDVGVEQDILHGRVRTSLTAFRSTYRDLVDFSAQLFRLVNRQQASTRGVEFAASIPVNTHLEFSARASYLDWHLQLTNEASAPKPAARAKRRRRELAGRDAGIAAQRIRLTGWPAL